MKGTCKECPETHSRACLCPGFALGETCEHLEFRIKYGSSKECAPSCKALESTYLRRGGII